MLVCNRKQTAVSSSSQPHPQDTSGLLASRHVYQTASHTFQPETLTSNFSSCWWLQQTRHCAPVKIPERQASPFKLKDLEASRLGLLHCVDLLRNHTEHLQVDAVELIKAGPRAAAGQPLEKLALHSTQVRHMTLYDIVCYTTCPNQASLAVLAVHSGMNFIQGIRSNA